MKDLDPNYTSKCSLQTICEPDKGFFIEFLESAREESSEKEFGKLTSNEERLDHVFNLGEVLGTLEHVSAIYKEKNLRLAVQRRLEGDNEAKTGNFHRALLLYSQSVIRSPHEGEIELDDGITLAKALWSRSAVLVALKKGELALNDLKYSQEMGIVVKDNPDYYWRMGQCYALMGEKKRAEIAFNVTEKMIQGRQILLEKLRTDQENLNSISGDQQKQNAKREFQLENGESEAIKGVSKLVTTSTTQEKGDYLVAKEAINIGSNLIVEDPVANVALPKFAGSHCHHCLRRVEAPVACSTCSGIAFCSLKCKNEAIYHRFECQFLDLIVGSGMSVLAQLTLRLITSCGSPEKAIEVNEKLIQSLVRHSGERSPQDFFNRTVMSAFLLRLLQKSDFFGRRTTESVEPSNKVEKRIACLMLDLLQSLQFNAHEIYETVRGEDHPINGSKMNYIGVGIYLSAAKCNHECFPALARYFDGNRLILTALRKLSPGDAIAENYGPTFIKHPLKDRKRMLSSRYWFACNCIACTEDWPILQHLTNKARLRCPTEGCPQVFRYPDSPEKKVKCVKCKQMVSLFGQCGALKECEILYKKAAKEMEDQRLEEAVKIFETAISRFHDVALPPHKDTHLALESLRVCYGHRGNVVKRV